MIKNNFNIIIQSYHLQTSKRIWSSDLTETDDMQEDKTDLVID